jgi:hypothetical protein
MKEASKRLIHDDRGVISAVCGELKVVLTDQQLGSCFEGISVVKLTLSTVDDIFIAGYTSMTDK